MTDLKEKLKKVRASAVKLGRTADEALAFIEAARLAGGYPQALSKITRERDSLLAAIDKLRKVKGRYNSEQAFNELIGLADVMKRGGENAEK